MLEATVLCALAWLLLAAPSHRFRKEAGPLGPSAVAGLRSAAVALFAIALLRTGGTLPGERWVRLIGAMSLAGIPLVGLLSVVPAATLSPVRAALRVLRASSPRRAGPRLIPARK